MDIEYLLKQVTEMWNGNNTPCDYGCLRKEMDVMITEAKRIYPDKPYCTIEKWVWTDLTVNKGTRKLYMENGVQPAFVRSQHIIDDEAKRSHLTNAVRSTALVGFHKGCLFVTRNTCYILVGPGSRIEINPAILDYLVDW